MAGRDIVRDMSPDHQGCSHLASVLSAHSAAKQTELHAHTLHITDPSRPTCISHAMPCILAVLLCHIRLSQLQQHCAAKLHPKAACSEHMGGRLAQRMSRQICHKHRTSAMAGLTHRPAALDNSSGRHSTLGRCRPLGLSASGQP